MTKHCCRAVFHGKSIIFIAIAIVFSLIFFSIAAFCKSSYICGACSLCFQKAEVRLVIIGSQDFLLGWFFWSPHLEHGISCMPGGWTMPLNTLSTLLPPNGQGLDIAQGKCTSSRGQSLWRANVQNCANGAVAVTTIAVNLRYFVSTPAIEDAWRDDSQDWDVASSVTFANLHSF